jgi:creatinine amidohydrolase/Fe(II)-dependent formamide hydrolase-like protein
MNPPGVRQLWRVCENAAMPNTAFRLALAVAAMTVAAPSARAQPPPAPPRATASVNTQPRVDALAMPRPIDMHDTVWIEDLTMLEVRDLIKAGKTTALILTGGIEENGPYLTTGKHNNVLRVTGESIARALGTALIAPIVTLEPGNPERVRTPGTVFLSPATFKAVVTDMSVSLRTQGFTHIILLGDSGGNIKPLTEASEALNAKWKAEGVTARTYSIPEYYNYAEVEKFEQDELGIHEKLEGLHDDYYITSIIMVHDPNGVRMPERRFRHECGLSEVYP